ncbi:UPF0158 family protein [Pseudomonas oryziphila]|uniref:OST-HTH/LOTUS domain-containing protein n=1 Tax=Pseudomonas oryziphila TaxID=2894079 RepID=A0ABM7CU85_9PSED|nr:UPF0158 family protein [Pseudomonas oryziphila]AZL75037.1 hypothetical protein EI693_18945 [Pseudomonas oryziphila]
MDLKYLHTAILELLSDRPSEVGARLKQRLNRTLLNAGLPAFDEKQLGYRKFTEFLVAELGEHLIVEKPAEGGDIQITLKHPSVAAFAALAGQNDTAHSSSAKPLPVRLIRGDIWQAFTHLNEHRKRYLDRASGKVLHFLDSEATNVALVAETPERFVEIPRVDADTQLSWMQQFLAISSFPSAEAATLAQLLEQPYSSQLSVLFGRALGKRQPEWKRYRAERVTEVVQNWAGEHEIPLSPLFTFKIGRSEEAAEVVSSAPLGQLSPRDQAQKLLALMTEQEIVSIAIPALLGCVLANSRL